MAFRLVSSLGGVIDPAFVNVPASGTIHPSQVVDFDRTGGLGVTPASMNSSVTTIFGVCLDYVQGASDTYVRVVPFAPGQIWEVDCDEAVTTAHIGSRMGLSRTRDNKSIYPNATDSLTSTAVFQCIGMVGSTSGSGKLIGFFRAGMTTGVPTEVGNVSAY